MITRSRRPATSEERRTLQQAKGNWLSRLVARLFGSVRIFDRFQLLLAQDLAGDDVEVLTVRATALVEQSELVSEGPALFFESPEEPAVIILSGTYLTDPAIMSGEVAVPEGAPESGWFSAFEVERAPRSGVVFRLRVLAGPLLTPERRGGHLPFPLQSEVLPGTLARLDETLTHATMADVSPPPPRP